jgi:hypothetical protein
MITRQFSGRGRFGMLNQWPEADITRKNIRFRWILRQIARCFGKNERNILIFDLGLLKWLRYFMVGRTDDHSVVPWDAKQNSSIGCLGHH